MTTILFPSAERSPYLNNVLFKIICLFFGLAWCWFYATARDLTDWWLENILVILFFTGLFISQRKFVFSDISLVFIFVFLTLHIYGARMAYTQNELGEFLQNSFQLSRNPYDRIVHFSFGFLILYPLMDVINNHSPGRKNFKLLFANMFIFSLATAFELIEWGVVAFTDSATGETYVATQGDPWDAQKDIILAALGSLLFTGLLKVTKKNNTR